MTTEYEVVLNTGDTVHLVAPDKTQALLTAAELWWPAKPVQVRQKEQW